MRLCIEDGGHFDNFLSTCRFHLMHLKFTSNKCEIPTKLQQHSTCTQMRLTEDSPGAAAKTDRGDSSLLFIPRVGGMYTSAGPIPVRLGLFETESISASATD